MDSPHPSITPSTSMKLFASAVRRRMQDEGVSLRELSRRSGLGRASLLTILNDRQRSCLIESADKIAAAFKTTLTEMLVSESTRQPPTEEA